MSKANGYTRSQHIYDIFVVSDKNYYVNFHGFTDLVLLRKRPWWLVLVGFNCRCVKMMCVRSIKTLWRALRSIGMGNQDELITPICSRVLKGEMGNY